MRLIELKSGTQRPVRRVFACLVSHTSGAFSISSSARLCKLVDEGLLSLLVCLCQRLLSRPARCPFCSRSRPLRKASASGQASSQAFQPAFTPQQQQQQQQQQQRRQQQQKASAQQPTSTTCGIPDYAVPAVVCVALAILLVIVLCTVLDVRRSKALSNALN